MCIVIVVKIKMVHPVYGVTWHAKRKKVTLNERNLTRVSVGK